MNAQIGDRVFYRRELASGKFGKVQKIDEITHIGENSFMVGSRKIDITDPKWRWPNVLEFILPVANRPEAMMEYLNALDMPDDIRARIEIARESSTLEFIDMRTLSHLYILESSEEG